MLVKAIPRLHVCGNCLVRASKTIGGTKKQTELLIGPTHHAGLATIPSSSLRVGPVRRLDSLCLCDRDQTTGETKRCIGEATSTDILDQNVRFLCGDGTSWCETFCPPLRNVVTWPFRNLKIFANQGHSWTRRAGQTRSQRIGSCLHPISSNVFSVREPLIFGLRRYVLLARSCGADLEDHQGVFRTLWRVHRSWSLAIPAEFRTPVSHEIVPSVAMSASLHNVPELSLLTLFSFHCLLRPAEVRQLRWCDVNIVDGSLSTRHEKVFGIVHIKEPKTRRMAGHAAQQHVLLECPGICQLVRTMKSSIPDHRLDCSNLEIHCCSTPRLF